MEIAAEVWFWVGPKATGTARLRSHPVGQVRRKTMRCREDIATPLNCGCGRLGTSCHECRIDAGKFRRSTRRNSPTADRICLSPNGPCDAFRKPSRRFEESAGIKLDSALSLVARNRHARPYSNFADSAATSIPYAANASDLGLSKSDIPVEPRCVEPDGARP